MVMRAYAKINSRGRIYVFASPHDHETPDEIAQPAGFPVKPQKIWRRCQTATQSLHATATAEPDYSLIAFVHLLWFLSFYVAAGRKAGPGSHECLTSGHPELRGFYSPHPTRVHPSGLTQLAIGEFSPTALLESLPALPPNGAVCQSQRKQWMLRSRLPSSASFALSTFPQPTAGRRYV